MTSSSARDQSPHAIKSSETPRLPLVIWRDVFLVIDDGQVSLSEIEVISQRVRDLGLKYPGGVGGITVIPSTNARPPSDAHRAAIKTAYGAVSRHLKAMCWTVEGEGFRAATVRAALVGLRLLLHPPFPTKVAADLDEAVPWLCAHLTSSSRDSLAEGLVEIRRAMSDLQSSR